jgi:hypothetical protein
MWRIDPAIVLGVRWHHAPICVPEGDRDAACAAAVVESVLNTLPEVSFEGDASESGAQACTCMAWPADLGASLAARSETMVRRADAVLS